MSGNWRQDETSNIYRKARCMCTEYPSTNLRIHNHRLINYPASLIGLVLIIPNLSHNFRSKDLGSNFFFSLIFLKICFYYYIKQERPERGLGFNSGSGFLTAPPLHHAAVPISCQTDFAKLWPVRWRISGPRPAFSVNIFKIVWSISVCKGILLWQLSTGTSNQSTYPRDKNHRLLKKSWHQTLEFPVLIISKLF